HPLQPAAVAGQQPVHRPAVARRSRPYQRIDRRITTRQNVLPGSFAFALSSMPFIIIMNVGIRTAVDVILGTVQK
ncbi:MAG: hypothetical protein WD049_03310, partial [Candidatus Paceibacterota bacterium]